jgi:hypothetical protein
MRRREFFRFVAKAAAATAAFAAGVWLVHPAEAKPALTVAALRKAMDALKRNNAGPPRYLVVRKTMEAEARKHFPTDIVILREELL